MSGEFVACSWESKDDISYTEPRLFKRAVWIEVETALIKDRDVDKAKTLAVHLGCPSCFALAFELIQKYELATAKIEGCDRTG